MPSILIKTLVAAAIGGCLGLLWYGLTKIPAVQERIQKLPKWLVFLLFIVFLGIARLIYNLATDEATSLIPQQSSYDQDFTQQCLVLKEAFPDILKVEQLEKVRSITAAKDPEMMRAYLLGLASAKKAELEKGPYGMPNKADSLEHAHWGSIVQFYEDWVRPSPEGRAGYARKQGGIVAETFQQMPDMDYTISTRGPGSSTLVFRMKKPGYPITQTRDMAVAGLSSSSAKKYPQSVWAVGFTAHRYENSEGKGFTIKGTPSGPTLPLVEDDFK